MNMFMLVLYRSLEHIPVDSKAHCKTRLKKKLGDNKKIKCQKKQPKYLGNAENL